MPSYRRSRCQAGRSQIGSFLRYSSGAQKGQWGSEIWLRTGHQYLKTADRSCLGEFQSPLAVALHSDPRRLLLRVSGPRLSFLLVCLHAPNRATEAAAIETWWVETIKQIRSHLRDDFLLVAGDMNAAIGSEISEHFENLAAEKEDLPGTKLHELAQTFGLWGPSTFHAHHEGATHTYVQKKNQKMCRPDFVLLPMSWRSGIVTSWTSPTVHAAHPHQDHIAACV